MFFLSIRHLLSRKKQTLFTLLGIVLGATSYVVITGFFLGFQGFLIEQLVNNDAHIHITPKEKILKEHTLDKSFFGNQFSLVAWAAPPGGREDSSQINNPPQWYTRLASDPEIVEFSPLLNTQAIFKQANDTLSVNLIGCIPSKQVRVTNIEESMVQGNFSELNGGGNRLIVGKGLLDRLGIRVSQYVLVSTGAGAFTPFKVVGSFFTGIKMLDDQRAFGSLSDVQRINGTPNVINDIALRVVDYTKASVLSDTWSALSVDKIQSWDQTNANFLSVFKLQNIMRYIMVAIILIVAGFGIYNVLNMTVTQKQKEIAILRSMGFESSDIIELFFLQGFILGILGGGIGLVAGYYICRYLETVPFGGGPMGGAGYLHIAINPPIFIQGLALAVISASVASVLPARAAGKMTPIEIIREGTE